MKSEKLIKNFSAFWNANKVRLFETYFSSLLKEHNYPLKFNATCENHAEKLGKIKENFYMLANTRTRL